MNPPNVDLGFYHPAKSLSERTAFGFVKMLRFVADTFFAKRYWNLPQDATLRDVVVVVRADEAHHRDVNHGFANEIAGLPPRPVAGCWPHAAIAPRWDQAA